MKYLSFFWLFLIFDNIAFASDEYSINLMWITDFPGRNQKYIMDGDEETLKEKLLELMMTWARINPEGEINLWYDSKTIPENALENTKLVLAKEYGAASDRIQFKDTQDFAEVKENSQITFNVSIYFLVDLRRIIAAYHTLREANRVGKKHYFVYADLDVTPLSKEKLFDPKTQKNLDEFGIVIAHGGLNGHNFENCFQIFSSEYPNLLKAMKVALIDINIARANSKLKWYKSGQFQQAVYASYISMFYYYYYLQGWGTLKKYNALISEISEQTNEDRIAKSQDLTVAQLQPTGTMKQKGPYFKLELLEPNRPDIIQSYEEIFGLQEPIPISFYPTSSKVQTERRYFDDTDGKMHHYPTIKIPKKIIDAPASHFNGSRPTQYDPNKVTPKNFRQKLEQSLQAGKPFDHEFLILAVRNADISAVALMETTTNYPTITNNALGDLVGYIEGGDCVVLRFLDPIQEVFYDQVFYKKDLPKDPNTIRFIMVDISGTDLAHEGGWSTLIKEHFANQLDLSFSSVYLDFIQKLAQGKAPTHNVFQFKVPKLPGFFLSK